MPSTVPVTVVNVERLPTIRLETLLDILGERDSGVTVNGDVYAVS